MCFTNVSLSGVSPASTSLQNRYSSPPASSVCKRLFVDSEASSDSASTASVRVGQPLVSTIPAGQTVVTMATATVTANNGQTVTIPVQGV